MKRYLLNLTENISDQVLTDFDAFGAKIVWVSTFIPNLVSVETDKSKKELEQFFLVENASEEQTGTYNESKEDVKLKMYALGERDDWGCVYWICATSPKGVIDLYRTIADDIPDDIDQYIREMDNNEPFTYYHDGITPEKDMIGNLMDKYCSEPMIFACSEF